MRAMIPLITWDWPDTPILIAGTILLMLLVRWAANRAIKYAVDTSVRQTAERNADQGTRAERILAHATGLASTRHEARIRTVGSVMRSVVAVVVLVITVLSVLSVLGFPLAPLLTSAGIGGAALAFGAQSLVKDYLSGLFMLLEDQYGVGDLVAIGGDVTGTVEDVGLRITRLRDPNGQVWYIRNGEITKLGNQSQGYSTGTVNVPIAPNEDAEKAMGVLRGVMKEVFADPEWENVLLDEPVVAGLGQVSAGAMTIQIFAKCAPNQQWGVQRDILERSVQALRAAGIHGAPYVPPPASES